MQKFKVIVADCPWAFNDKLKMSSVARGAEANYDLLNIEDIKRIPVWNWVQDNSILALWVPSSLLQDGMDTMKAWGYNQKQIYTWVKTSKKGGLGFGMGRYFRGCTEHALIGTKGKIGPLSKSERNCDLHLSLPHSQKPETLQNQLEKMYPEGPYLELFARRQRPGWCCIGNEVPGMSIDIRDWEPDFEE
jgi:N6-adenosine-specific RNA methylase IME4